MSVGWSTAKRRAGLIGAFAAALLVYSVRTIFFIDETEPLRRRWRRRAGRK